MNSKDYIPRIVETYAFDENLIGRHMVFLAGPRQVGKTLLAKHRLKHEGCETLYFNWDDIATRQAYFSDSRFFESPARATGIQDPLIVFDEIHKRNHWSLYGESGRRIGSRPFVIARNNVPILAVEVKTRELTLSNPLKNRATWFPDTPILGIQVIDRRDVLRKYSENTWLMGIERFLALFV